MANDEPEPGCMQGFQSWAERGGARDRTGDWATTRLGSWVLPVESTKDRTRDKFSIHLRVRFTQEGSYLQCRLKVHPGVRPRDKLETGTPTTEDKRGLKVQGWAEMEILGPWAEDTGRGPSWDWSVVFMPVSALRALTLIYSVATDGRLRHQNLLIHVHVW